MNVDIRLAQASDLSTLEAIYEQAVHSGRATGDLTTLSAAQQASWFASHRPDTTPIYVAERAGVVVGYNALSEYRGGRGAFRYVRETSYFVHHQHHRCGIASALLDHVLAECAGLLVRSLITFVLAHNEPSLRLLDRYGFQVWGRLPGVADFDGLEYDHLILGRRV